MNQGPAYAIAFFACAGLAVLGAVWVAILPNIVRSAFALLATFVGVAGLYVLLAADLVAIVQVMVYVGGILVLMLFAVMLTARIDAANVSNRSFGAAAAAALVLPAVAILVLAVLGAPLPERAPAAAEPTTAVIGAALLGPYVLPFEAVSLLLLAALLGAVTLSRGWGTLSRTPVSARARGGAGAPAPDLAAVEGAPDPGDPAAGAGAPDLEDPARGEGARS